MTYRLTTSSVDDDEEVTEHQTLADAIDAAERWFREGYDNPTIGEIDLAEDVERLREDLAAGREFRCGKFHERISIKAAE